jgi:tetratricopeptide (TPR) repeat protein
MNKNIIQNKSLLLVLMLGLMLSSCFKDEYLNPSQASNESVITNTNGLLALCNGLQQKYTIGRASPLYTSITANGLTTNELLVLNQGNTDEANLQAGKANVIGNNQVVTRLWEQSLLIVGNADLILTNIGIVGDANTKNSILAFAHLYKGLALMNLGTYWEQAPIATGKQASFVPRKQVLETAVKLFEDGANLGVITLHPSLQGGIDFNNTFNALAARGNMILGNYAKALELANKVDLKKKSEFTFDAVSRNPIFDVHYSNVNVCEPTNNRLGLPAVFAPDTTDARLLFYLKSRTFGATNDGKGFFTANDAKIPVYLPGEVMLLKAEALARQDKIDEAIAELNKVRTKADDVYNVNAKLPAYSGANSKDAVLAEIYLNRCVELYNSGLKLEDSRRFNRPGPKETNFERTRNFYPYPTTERDNNPNTPADPEI